MNDAVDALDPALVTLADAAEAGRATPVIYVLTGAWLVRGHPVRPGRFAEKTWAHWRDELTESSEFKTFRGSAIDRDAAVRERLGPDFMALHTSEPTAGRTLTLSNGLVTTNAGASFEVPVLRLQLAAVQGWWASSFVVNEPKAARATGTGFGLAIPLGF